MLKMCLYFLQLLIFLIILHVKHAYFHTYFITIVITPAPCPSYAGLQGNVETVTFTFVSSRARDVLEG